MTGTDLTRDEAMNAPNWVTEIEEHFSQRTRPIHHIRPKTRVEVRFVPFRYSENDRYELDPE